MLMFMTLNDNFTQG